MWIFGGAFEKLAVMNAAWVCLGGIAMFAAGYFFYSRILARRVFDLRADEPVPSRELEDGVDYVPTHKHVLFGHHYASIAGAAPIIGPAIAVIWGWVPAFLWIVLGTIFMGAVHDFSTLVMSVRHQGRSVGLIAQDVIAPRTRTLFLLVIFFLVMLIIAVFAIAISRLFVKHPSVVIPINFEIIVAVLIGWFCYRKKKKLLIPSLLSLVSLYAMVFVGVKVPVSLAAIVGEQNQMLVWVVLLLGYAFVASTLPVWVLLQPRDYINSHQLFVGLAALVTGILVAQPVITAPAFVANPPGAPSWFPFLFVTIACGAISGFHGLVSSGTSSKQLGCATDARLVGYGSMIGEGTLALIATLAVSAGLSDWATHYPTWQVAEATGLANFVTGAASFLTALKIPPGPAEVLVAVLVISFAATTLDTGVRIQRYVLQELAETYSFLAFLKNRYAAALFAVGTAFCLYYAEYAGRLWPLFGTTNQLLAALSLTVVFVWLYRTGRPLVHVAIPMVFLVCMTALAMVSNLVTYFRDRDYLFMVVGALLLALEVWLVLEGMLALRKRNRVTKS